MNEHKSETSSEMSDWTIKPIGLVKSPFSEKFGLPRQPGMLKGVKACIELFPPYSEAAAWKGIEDFSHLWLQFIFHQVQEENWRPQVRPPRLGGNDKVGVFCSRSPFRPNRIGSSVVELLACDTSGGKVTLHIACPDIVDGTPIIDIKPYIAYCDSVPSARCGYAQNPPELLLKVIFSGEAKQFLNQLDAKIGDLISNLITQTLQYDPRPAYQSEHEGRLYGLTLSDMNIKWHVEDKTAIVDNISRKM